MHYRELFDFRKNVLFVRDEKDEVMPVADGSDAMLPNAESFPRMTRAPTVYDAPRPSQLNASPWFCLPCMFDYQNRNRLKTHFDTEGHKAKQAEYDAWKVAVEREEWFARMSSRFARALDDEWDGESEEEDESDDEYGDDAYLDDAFDDHAFAYADEFADHGF
jgi:hypothetical protein